MRRNHLMIALFGLTAISTPVFAAPPLKLPSAPAFRLTQPPFRTQPLNPNPLFRNQLDNRFWAQPTPRRLNNIARSERRAQDRLGTAFDALGQLGSGQFGDTGSVYPNGGGFGQSFVSPVQGSDILPTGYSSEATPANVEPAAAQEWGMKVTQVGSGGAAAQADLRVNDIIVAAAGKRIQSFEDLTAVLAAAKGPIEMVIVNGENNKLEKMKIVPASGKIGIMTEPVVME